VPLHGTWKVTGGGGPDIPVVPAVAAVMAVALAVWLATILLIVAVVLTVVAGLLVAVAVMMRRRYPDHSEQVAADLAVFRAEVTAPKAARPAVTVVNNYYTLPGETAGEASWVPLVRGAVEHKED
jgi:heme/copper-type cytochrome/quinol oxidase subunit 2